MTTVNSAVSVAGKGCNIVEQEVLAEDDVTALTQETLRIQDILLNQLKLLGVKSKEQEDQLARNRSELENSEDRYSFAEKEKQKLERCLKEAESKHSEMHVEVVRLTSANEFLRAKLQENDTTVCLLQALVQEHNDDAVEVVKRAEMLESELEEFQNKYSLMEETMENVDIIRYEIQSQDEQEKPLEDFLEDIVERSSNLQKELKNAQTDIIDYECKILDMEMYVNTLKETLKEAHSNYAEQSEESRDLEDSLRRMQVLHKEQAEELETLQTEREIYQSDIKNMLDKLRNLEEENKELNDSTQQSRTMAASYQEQLVETLVIVEALRKEKKDDVMTLELKEAVIKTLQESSEKTKSLFMEKLETYTADDDQYEMLNSGEDSTEAMLNMIESGFNKISADMNQKDDLIIHLMSEKEQIQTKLEQQKGNPVLEKELSELKRENTTLAREVKMKSNQLEENELVITHLVSVVNRYAYSDKDLGEQITVRPKRPSMDSTSQGSIRRSSNRRSLFGRLSLSSYKGSGTL